MEIARVGFAATIAGELDDFDKTHYAYNLADALAIPRAVIGIFPSAGSVLLEHDIILDTQATGSVVVLLTALLANLTAFGLAVGGLPVLSATVPTARRQFVPPDSPLAEEAALTSPDHPPPPSPASMPSAVEFPTTLAIGLPVLVLALVAAIVAVREKRRLEDRNRALLMDNGRAENWQEMADPTGNVYYLNALTGQILYEMPVAVANSRSEAREPRKTFVSDVSRRLSRAFSLGERALVQVMAPSDPFWFLLGLLVLSGSF